MPNETLQPSKRGNSDSPSEPRERKEGDPQSDADIARYAEVKEELNKCKRAKARYEHAFKRMRRNMEFVWGIQWDEQRDMHDDRYRCNVVLGAVKQKEATLYARNPTVKATRRKRMDFQLWDGTVEMLQDAFVRSMKSQMAAHAGAGLPDLEAMAIMKDFMNGRQYQALVKKVCDTIEIIYQYQIDEANPDFKEQMKSFVCRVITCGVAHIVPSFIRETATVPSTTEFPHGLSDRLLMVKSIADKLDKEEIKMDSKEMEELRSLLLSVGMSTMHGDYTVKERIEFDFPPSTTVFPDENCRNIVGFVAARRVYQEFAMTADEINTFFGLEGEKKVTAKVPKDKGDATTEYQMLGDDPKAEWPVKPKVTFWRVFNIETKTDYFLAQGHKDYLREPMPLEAEVKGFWPIVTVAFNNIETDPDTKADIFPPSDVDLMRDPQMERNRTRDALRGQRNANAPTYLVRKNSLSEADKQNIKNRVPNEVVELENVPPDKTPSQMIEVLQVAKIDPALYDTAPQDEDIQLAAHIQQADIGPAQPDVTATVGTIAEQNRMTVSSSNVDDLDMGLSKLASMCGQMILQLMSEPVAKEIAGPGAALPTMNKDTFLNQISLTIRAASSGRPNQALRTSVRERIIPLILQAGGNPIAAIEELVNTMDDQLDPLDVQKFFPVPGQAIAAMSPPSQPNGPPGGITPPSGGRPQPAVNGSRTAPPRQGVEPRPETPLAAGVPFAQ